MSASTSPGVETKVAAQGTVSLICGILAQLGIALVNTYTGVRISISLSGEITAFAAVIPGLLAGYFAPHTPRPDLETVEADVAKAVRTVETVQLPATPTPNPVGTSPGSSNPPAGSVGKT